MTDDARPLSHDERDAALVDLPDWRANLDALHAAYECASASEALALIAAIGRQAEIVDHHPDVDWRYRHVFLRLSTHSAGGVITGKDIALATVISRLAAAGQAQARPGLPRSIEIAIDTADLSAIKDFWVTATGYRENSDGHLVDPWRRSPTVWFQPTDTPDPSRFHLDLSVDVDAADDLIADIESHGGRAIDRRYQPAFTVMADADGNRICICTPHDGNAADA